MSKKHPRVKAMGLFVWNGRVLAAALHDASKNEDFLRLPGGSVEFGETTEAALRREMREEMSAEIAIHRLLGVVENIFVYEGTPGHEVVFIYHAAFVDPGYYTRETIAIKETEDEHIGVWTPLEDVVAHRVRLYPSADYKGFLELIAEQGVKP
jgi:ADP-ribose pyrophosphatase YjhB (NUDIX family)